MAPLWKSMLSKSSPLYRESLFSFSLWESRVQERELAFLRKQLERERRALQRQTEKLSKELQQKDKIIESLRSKLKQERPDTPSSSHALSETTDQSDRTSFVSDEQGSIHEDLDLCSDVDATSEYSQEGQPSPKRQTQTDSHCHGGTTPKHSSIPSSSTASHGAQSTINCPSMPCTQHKPMDSPGQKGFAVPHPHVKPLSGFPLAGHAHPNPGGYVPLSHHAFSQPQFSTPGASSTLKADASLLESSALWDMAHISRPIRTSTYGDVSSGSSGYQSGTSHTGTDLIEEHLKEIRSLRQRLEDSIQTNDRLRQQLESRLGTTGREGGAPTNIYIQGLDSVSQLSNENRALKEENLGLHARLQQNNRDKCKEAEQLREVVLAARARLKQAELEAEQWREESRRLQARGCEQAQEIQQLRQDRHGAQERTNRLQHQVNLLQQQLSESRQLLHSLQCELQVYERVRGAAADPHAVGCGVEENLSSRELRDLLSEVRSLRAQLEHSVKENSSLRAQLEKQLGRGIAQGETHPSSTQHDNSCRKQLFHDPAPSPPVRDTGLFTPGSTYSGFSKVTELDDPEATANGVSKAHPALEGGAPDGSFASRKGRHTIGHVDDFRALQQQILEGKVLVHKMETVLQATLSAALLEYGSAKALDYSNMDTLLSNSKTLGQILDEAASLLKMFWRAALPSSELSAQHTKKEQSMKEEIKRLRLRVTEQEELLQETVEKLRSSNRTKQGMEHFIVSQLSRTRDVLKKARANLEVKSQDAPVNPLLTGVS